VCFLMAAVSKGQSCSSMGAFGATCMCVCYSRVMEPARHVYGRGKYRAAGKGAGRRRGGWISNETPPAMKSSGHIP
jgi:hypothetical protein